MIGLVIGAVVATASLKLYFMIYNSYKKKYLSKKDD